MKMNAHYELSERWFRRVQLLQTFFDEMQKHGHRALTFPLLYQFSLTNGLEHFCGGFTLPGFSMNEMPAEWQPEVRSPARARSVLSL